MILFLAVIGAVAAVWLSRQGLATKPWLEADALADFAVAPVSPVLVAKIGLGVFLAVIGCLFALLISAYFVRTGMPDWHPPPAPRLLWLNTIILIASSVALQLADWAARRGDVRDVRAGLAVGGLSAIAFLGGQILAWRQLAAEGYLLSSNPGSSFFYLLTAVHGLHIAGGLVALGRAGDKLRRGAAIGRVRLAVQLCAIYWHFLLLVWLVLFIVLMGWSESFAGICRAWLS